jgi:hypothetical protein
MSVAARNGERTGPLKVFCSYAHEDEEFRAELGKVLGLLQNQGMVVPWDDRKLLAGAKWDGVIKEKLESADLILFLLSIDLLLSPYVLDTEVEFALKRADEGATIVPILVRPVDYEGSPFEDFNIVPGDAMGPKPVSKWDPRDDAYHQISREIRRIAKERKAGTGRPERFWGVPQSARGLVGRDALVQRLADAFASHEVGGAVALVGVGGVGKTSVAVEYAERHRDDYDLVAWVRAEKETRLADEFSTLAGRVGLAGTDHETARAALRQWLANPDRWSKKRWLLVFDNATGIESVRGHLPDEIFGHVLITSRDESIWSPLAHEIKVHSLSEDYAVRYLLEQTASNDEGSARKLARINRCLPLALVQAVGSIRAEGMTIAEYVEELEVKTTA